MDKTTQRMNEQEQTQLVDFLKEDTIRRMMEEIFKEFYVFIPQIDAYRLKSPDLEYIRGETIRTWMDRIRGNL